MRKKCFQPEELIGNLRHTDVLLGQGKNATEGVKVLRITDVTVPRSISLRVAPKRTKPFSVPGADQRRKQADQSPATVLGMVEMAALSKPFPHSS